MKNYCRNLGRHKYAHGKCVVCGYPQFGTWERLVLDFWKRVKKSDGCWIWTGGRTKGNYGTISLRGKSIYAHRLSFIIHGNVLAPDLEICHTCDNNPCVHPEHLFQDTHKVNIQDMIKKKGPPRAKATQAQVLEVRARFSNGEAIPDLAKIYGLDAQLIERIVTRKTWNLAIV
jgi:hypothetical protein